MKLSEAIQLAQHTVIQSEALGFNATAKAMRDVLDEMLVLQRGIMATQDRSSEHLQALTDCS